MPWLDTARTQEPAEDRELRADLAKLLGMPAQQSFFEAEPTPEMVALAEELRREAERRRRTARPSRPIWKLAAVAMPLAAAVVAMAGWGFRQKQRADQMSATMRQKEQEIQRMAQTSSAEITKERQARRQVIELVNNYKPAKGKRLQLPPELVIPIEETNRVNPLSTMTVKDTGR